MRKIDRAVEIIRGWSDEDLKDLILVGLCPYQLGLGEKCMNDEKCRNCWNEEEVDALRRREEKRIERDFACRENEGDTQ